MLQLLTVGLYILLPCHQCGNEIQIVNLFVLLRLKKCYIGGECRGNSVAAQNSYQLSVVPVDGSHEFCLA